MVQKREDDGKVVRGSPKKVYKRTERKSKKKDLAVEGIAKEIDDDANDGEKATDDDANDGEKENGNGTREGGEGSEEGKEEDKDEEVEEDKVEETEEVEEDEEETEKAKEAKAKANEEEEAKARATSDNADKGEVEKGDMDSRGKSIQMVQDASDDEEDPRAMQPQNMYFNPSEYTKSVKIATRCKVGDAVNFLEQFPVELKWLRENEQFKHVFHLPMEPNHQVQGLWMLILRTTCTELQRECWFLVNGRLIRYSIREHALLTGFNCKEYPLNWEKLGSLDFALRVLKKTKGIKISMVEQLLLSMKNKKPTGDRMKLAVLYFLAQVLKAKNKHDPAIDVFLMRMVNDLSVCETFPWGRYTFNDCVKSIKGVAENMKKGVKVGAQPGFNGFIVPAEILAFECIPILGRKFGEDIRADLRCPRMCKRKFITGDNKGFPLEDINVTLGDNKEIISILQPTKDEKALMSRILEDDVDDGFGFIDPVVESWRDCLLVQKKQIFWKEWYKKDVEARTRPASSLQIVEAVVEKKKVDPLEEVLVKAVEKGFAILMGALGELDAKVVEKISVLQTKVQNLHNLVTERGVNVFAEEEVSKKMDEGEKVDDGDKLEKGKVVEETVAEEVDDGDMNEKAKEEKKQEEKEKKRKIKDENKDNKKKPKVGENKDLVMASGTKRVSRKPSKFTPGESKNRS